MQQLDIYLRASSVKATIVDMYNNASNDTASITRGMKAEFILHLFHSEVQDDVFTAEDLSIYGGWSFYADSDYNQSTVPKLQVTSGIYVDEDGAIHIPIENTNTQEMVDYLGTSETKTLTGEIVGVQVGEDTPGFILQWGFNVRNRIGGLEDIDPTELPSDIVTKSELNAILSASYEIEYSVDGDNWSAENNGDAKYIRFRNSAVETGQWTVATLVAGPKGDTGLTDNIYIAYASDSAGSDFSTTPSEELKYRAEFHTTEEIADPTLDDFQHHNAIWVKYIGDGGDMYTYDYVDAGGTGIVLSASRVESVEVSQIIDGGRTLKFSDYDPKELYTDKQIIEATSVISNGILNIGFDDILVSSGGESYEFQAGDVITWEYWVHGAAIIDEINISGGRLNVKDLDTEILPSYLPRLGEDTLHVFAVRGYFSDEQPNDCKLVVNYMYSVEA